MDNGAHGPLRPAVCTEIEFRCFTPVEPKIEDETDDQVTGTTEDAATATAYRSPEVDAPEPET